jgi:hypothetical protein
MVLFPQPAQLIQYFRRTTRPSNAVRYNSGKEVTVNHQVPIETGNVTVDSGALIAMYALPDDVRESVLHTLNDLSAVPPHQWPADKVRPHWSVRQRYILKAPDDLRIFFRRAEDGKIAIANIMRQETLDLYSNGNSTQGGS